MTTRRPPVSIVALHALSRCATAAPRCERCGPRQAVHALPPTAVARSASRLTDSASSATSAAGRASRVRTRRSSCIGERHVACSMPTGQGMRGRLPAPLAACRSRWCSTLGPSSAAPRVGAFPLRWRRGCLFSRFFTGASCTAVTRAGARGCGAIVGRLSTPHGLGRPTTSPSERPLLSSVIRPKARQSRTPFDERLAPHDFNAAIGLLPRARSSGCLICAPAAPCPLRPKRIPSANALAQAPRRGPPRRRARETWGRS